MLYFYAYTSELVDPQADAAAILRSIRRVAKVRNAELGITGVLFFDSGRFLQVLEGEQDKLDELMAAISRDPRHRNITYLFQEPIARRSFSEWNMDTLDLSGEDELSEAALLKVRDAYAGTFKANAGAFITIAKSLLSDPRFARLIDR